MSNKNRRKRNKNFLCVDCLVDCSEIKEHYFVNNTVWFIEARAKLNEQLCINCLEKRLKRKLTPKDFTDAYINNPKKNNMSILLRNRILGIL